MAELVEERAGVIERKQSRLAFRRLGEIADIVDDRQLALSTILQWQFVLRLERTHPCAGPLGRPGEIIAEEERLQGTAIVAQFEHPHIRMIGGNAFQLGQRHAEQALGDIEAGFDDLFELQIGLQLGFGEGESPLAQLLGIITPVPWHDRVVLALFRHQLAEACFFLNSLGAGLLPDLVQQVVHIVGGLCHRVVELQGRKVFITQKLRLFRAQRQRLANDRDIVPRTTVFTARHPGLECLLAQVAPGRKG
ncbi:hypothetical protein D3C80_841590 [compost metagenome]